MVLSYIGIATAPSIVGSGLASSEIEWGYENVLSTSHTVLGDRYEIDRLIFTTLDCDENIPWYVVSGDVSGNTYLVVFGVTKALFNFIAGMLCDQWGRRKTHVLGWLFAVPLPFLVLYSISWTMAVSSNIFSGMHEALSWSSAIYMMVDMCTAEYAGFAVGINETTGYVFVAIFNVISADLIGEPSPLCLSEGYASLTRT
jgi:MFS family permease